MQSVDTANYSAWVHKPCRLEKAEVFRESAKGGSGGGGGGGGAIAAAAAAATRIPGERSVGAAPTISRPRTGWVSSASQSAPLNCNFWRVPPVL